MGICNSKMIQFLPPNHSNTNCVITILIHSAKMQFGNVFITLLCCVDKDMTSSTLSWHKRCDFQTAIFSQFLNVLANSSMRVSNVTN